MSVCKCGNEVNNKNKVNCDNVNDKYSRNSKIKYIMKELILWGARYEEAASVCGNIAQESDYNLCAIGDSGTSGGLCQWHNTRFEDLKEFSGGGNKWFELEKQVAFLIHELKNKYTFKSRKPFFELMRPNGNRLSMDKLTEIFCIEFERPNMKYAELDKRKEYTKEAYSVYMEALKKQKSRKK